MIYYSKNVLNKEIDITKNKNSKEYILCHYWCWSIMGLNFKIQFAGFVLMMSPNVDIAIITFEGNDYYCIIYDVSKADATHLLANSMLDDREFI